MPSLIELTSEIVSAHASATPLSQEQLLEQIQKVHATLKALESGTVLPVADSTETYAEQPKLTIKQAFKKDQVICMICNKGFKTLKRHLAQAHDMKPGQYRKQFGIPSTQSLAAKSYSESRRQMAIDRNLGDGLVKAREKRAANTAKKKAASKKAK